MIPLRWRKAWMNSTFCSSVGLLPVGVWVSTSAITATLEPTLSKQYLAWAVASCW
jgi:hypothetical protein